MAATHLDSWKLANFVDGTETPDAEDFRRRVQIALVRAAKAVAGEPQGSFRGRHWIKRSNLAANILAFFLNAAMSLICFLPILSSFSNCCSIGKP